MGRKNMREIILLPSKKYIFSQPLTDINVLCDKWSTVFRIKLCYPDGTSLTISDIVYLLEVFSINARFRMLEVDNNMNNTIEIHNVRFRTLEIDNNTNVPIEIQNEVIKLITNNNCIKKLILTGVYSPKNIRIIMKSDNFVFVTFILSRYTTQHAYSFIYTIARTKIKRISFYKSFDFDDKIINFLRELWKNHNIIEVSLSPMDGYNVRRLRHAGESPTIYGVITDAIIAENVKFAKTKKLRMAMGLILCEIMYQPTMDFREFAEEIVSRAIGETRIRPYPLVLDNIDPWYTKDYDGFHDVL
jgi:hypothetical protein